VKLIWPDDAHFFLLFLSHHINITTVSGKNQTCHYNFNDSHLPILLVEYIQD